ncbi:Dimethylaniline monooxygenase [N-oxide-forming] 5 [Cyphellophora attinorum]|uniref:Dimethylaniline monooxygenase [N-oxide-forming] 5 n=1 Tax=Cyphellophora attinorum TaxID=1664694 RepID=A0A0N1HPF9_9EURO|nr:Dimethylaniline monooxygenase [N-oxide-forming] 5 [Phialophora attinorum]KPI37132.1 Dimethylaniline monooxygenase [N-oxide-forming] 5 [Phialophora attinorum]
MALTGSKIAIVGAGPGGLTALKELREVGADVTLFERRHDVGGLWCWTEDTSVTTALRETQICNSKYYMALSDFPMGQEYAPHLDAVQMGKYLSAYADQFDLRKNIQFGKSITRLERDHKNAKWLLHVADDPKSPQAFDKVVWATGQFLKPKLIHLPGQEGFKGQVLHSTHVRNLADFKGKNVVVLGMGNTAADIAVALIPHAKQVYLSHRRGANIMCRTDADGLPGDLLQNPVVCQVMWWIEQNMPSLSGKLLDMVFDSNFKKKYGKEDPAWGFSKKAGIGDGLHTITCNDGLIPSVKNGKLASKSGIKRITGSASIELDSGEVISNIDAIIMCTGYWNDMEMLSEAVTYAEPTKTNPARPPNLYMNIFPPKYADSIAVASFNHVNGAQPPVRELTAMALAQIWAGNSSLPSQTKMHAWIAKHDAWRRPRITKEPNLHQGDIVTRPYMYFLHDAAGTDMYEHIGWGAKAWKLWWSDRALYNALAYGPATAYGHRLFETGKRRTWKGARQAIIDTAAEVKELQAAAGQKKKKA